MRIYLASSMDSVATNELDPDLVEWCESNNITIQRETEQLVTETGQHSMDREYLLVDLDDGPLLTEFFLRFN